MATPQSDPPLDIRWYQSKGLNKGTRQLKFAGVPDKDVPRIVAAVQALFPTLKPF